MEDSNLRAATETVSRTAAESTMPPSLQEPPAADVSADVARATTKAAALIDAHGAESPDTADSLLDDERLGASSSAAVGAAVGGGKPQRKYERKTKRFVWPDELHRLFVASIFDLGLKHASPKALMPFMGAAASSYGLTTEHLKSHLQKYRLNYERSRVEFLEFYDETAQRNQKRRRRSAGARGATPTGGEQQTMFVFPIRAQRSSENGDAADADRAKSGTSNADNDDEDDDDDEDDEDMDEEDEVSEDTNMRSATAHAHAARRRTDSNASAAQKSAPSVQQASAFYYQQLLQQAHAASMASPHHHRHHHTHRRGSDAANAGELARLNLAAAGHFLPPSGSKSPQELLGLAQQYASHGLAFPGAGSGGGVYESTAAATATAAAAAAAAAASGAPLTDPQWSILASLLSPHLTAATAAAASAGHHHHHQQQQHHHHHNASQHPRTRSLADDAFLLDAGEPSSELQVQMHMAMQAQMNLHRQMLERKVAVSQNAFQGLGHLPPGAMHELQQQQQQWAMASAAEHLPPTHALRLHQQPQQHAPSFQQQLHHHHPHHQQQQQQYQPYGFPPSSSGMASGPPPLSSSSGSQNAATHTAPLASSSAPPLRATITTTASGVTTSTVSAVAAAAAVESSSGGRGLPPPPPPPPADAAAPMNPLDIYRWEQMDLQMNLSDEEEGDLFGFLRS